MKIKNSAEVDAKLNRLSEISSSIGQIAAVSIVIPFLVDKFNPVMLIWGLVMAITFWILSILFAQ